MEGERKRHPFRCILLIMKDIVKHVIVFVSIILISGCQSQHLLFKGIPIDGKLDSFTLEMKKHGFSVVEDGPRYTTRQEYNGVFLSDDIFDSRVTAFATDVTKTVYEVMVVPPSSGMPDFYPSKFKAYMNLLQEKYGEPKLMKYPYKETFTLISFAEKDADGTILERDSVEKLSTELDELGMLGFLSRYDNETFEQLSYEDKLLIEERYSGNYVATYDNEKGEVRLLLNIKLDAIHPDNNQFGLVFLYLDRENHRKYQVEQEKRIQMDHQRVIDDL